MSINFVLISVKFRLNMRISHILAGIFSAAEKTAAKINSANIFVRMSLILKNFRRRQRVKGGVDTILAGIFSAAEKTAAEINSANILVTR